MKAHTEKVVMYTTPFCGYCAAAKRLLRGKNVEFTEINVMFNRELREEMMEKSGRTTVPQIFVGETHVGGYDDLSALEAKGELDELLAGAAARTNDDGRSRQPVFHKEE